METVKQKTLKGSFSLFGKGLHTGLSLTVTFNPAPENTGYKIQRIDLDGQPIIDAVAENVVDTQRGTVLAKGEARVSTIEHGMSALYAMGIDNCLIQINGPEFPILDGSATMYVDKINEVGIVDQNAPTLTLSLLAVNLLHWMISILMQPRLLQHVHSFLYVTLCHSCRLI